MNFKIDFDNLLNMDLHMHTKYSDGSDSASLMLKSAADKGFKVIGISDHSYTFFDESYCIKLGDSIEYDNSVLLLKEKCVSLKDNPRFAKALGSDDIMLYLGIEQDYYSHEPTDIYDYIIGSVHYVRIPKAQHRVIDGCHAYLDYIYIPVDETPEIFKEAVNEYFDGDIYAFLAEYFKTVSDVVNTTNADIIGHFDLVTKFNENNALFDPENERYKNAWKKAADNLLKTDAVFEINTGAIAKGYRSVPYPSAEIIDYIKENGGKFILSSDAHSAANIGFGFKDYYDLI